MDFSKVKDTYKSNAPIQKEMAHNLVSNLIKLKGKSYDTVFEIGSGTGFLTENIKEKIKYNKIILNDLSDNFTNIIPNEYLKGDILDVDLNFKSDLIISNAAIQWIDDYNKLFSKLYNNLNFGGIFCFTTFGKDNFRQIKDITGFGLNYPDLDEFIKKAGFEILYFEQELNTMYFKNINELLLHIKLTGVKVENKVWTKKDLLNFKNRYLEKYKDDMGYELTYHPLYYYLTKPHNS